MKRILFIALLTLTNTSFACDGLDYITQVSSEATKKLIQCAVDIQVTKVLSRDCDIAAHFSEVIWEHIDKKDCKLSKEQRRNLIHLDFSLTAFNDIVNGIKEKGELE